jgi:hypothetical protein
MRISKESVVIGVIGLADLGTTLLWVRQHGAREANPVFAQYLAMGFSWFVAMKVVFLAAPIFMLEWARIRRPRFTLLASRFAICAYVFMYGVGFVRLNGDLFAQRAANASTSLESEVFLKRINASWMRRHSGYHVQAYQKDHGPRTPADLAAL